jgi:glycosyltransferase involved in cell wall biosynthesis
LRILFLNPVSVIGGAERSLLDLMASLRHAHPMAELHLLVPAEGPLKVEAERLGVRTTLLPMPRSLTGLGDSGLRGRSGWRAAVTLLRSGIPAGWAVWRYARRLRGAIESLHPDVVHSNGMKFHLLAALASARQNPTPVVWHLRDLLGRRRVMSRLLALASRKVAGVVAISQAVAEDARHLLRDLPIVVVKNAIDCEEFRPGPSEGSRIDELAGLPPAPRDVVRIGLVAAFARWKGQDVFLDAATRLSAQSLDRPVRYYLVGGPLYQTPGSQWSLDELRARSAGLVTNSSLGFVGFQRDTASIYRALDIVVHASTQPEPFGRTIVEAMACARAVIVSNAGGAAELFTHDHDAVGVPPGDADALAATIRELVNNPARRERLGAAARLTVLERFARERLGPQVLDAYRSFGVIVPTSNTITEVSAACPL